MRAFAFLRPRTLEAAAAALASEGATLAAGGMDLLDRMKERVDEPEKVVGLVDVGGSAREIRAEGRALRIGALATLAEIAAHPDVRAVAPALAHAAGEAASPQIRHRATLGGNLAQHTRCGYYRHASFPCLRRGDEACPVLADGGVQETAAIFANSPCASAHPSSVAPALGALDARVEVLAGGKTRTIGIEDLWAEPRRGRRSDLALLPEEVIAAILLDVPEGARQAHEEVRQRAAFDWAMVSCAVRLDLDGDGRVAAARIWLGSVAPMPWRALSAEMSLDEVTPSAEAFARAADLALFDATPLAGNRHKVTLARVAVRRALERAAGSP